jgi:hypothetical protein
MSPKSHEKSVKKGAPITSKEVHTMEYEEILTNLELGYDRLALESKQGSVEEQTYHQIAHLFDERADVPPAQRVFDVQTHLKDLAQHAEAQAQPLIYDAYEVLTRAAQLPSL